jgi:hypothetical protein
VPQQRSRPQDTTGRQRDKLAAEHAEVLRVRDQQIAMTHAANVELDNSVHDTLGDQPMTQTDDDGQITYIESPAKVVRVNCDLDLTLGAGNSLEFKEGQQYRVSADVAGHLEEHGYIWH